MQLLLACAVEKAVRGRRRARWLRAVDEGRSAMAANVTRRGFVAGTAVAGAAMAASGAVSAIAEEAAAPAAAWDEKPESVAGQVASTENHEIVVVGAGNSGMICALEAAQLGGDVLVVERNATYVTWAGDIDACDSQLQKDKGVVMDKEVAVHEISRYASGKCDENLVRLWAYNSGPFVDWYQEQLQKKGLDVMVDVHKKCFFPEGSYLTNAYHTAYKPPLEETANPMGSEVAMPAIAELLEEAGGSVVYNTKVVELVQGEDGAVTGVIAQAEDGSYVQYNASRGVVLATGGFSGNKDMMDALGIEVHKYCSNHTGGDGRNGDGIKLAMWAGGKLQEYMEGAGAVFDRGCITSGEDGDLGGQGGTNGAFWWPGSQPFLRVNTAGRRFCNEDAPYDFAFNKGVLQPGHTYWQVFDSSSWEDVVSFDTTICSRVVAKPGAKNCLLLGQFYPCRNAQEWDEVYIEPNVENGNLLKADTLEELAEAMGVPAETFVATVERYNGLAAEGCDTDQGKAPWRLSAVDEPPYYAAKMAGWLLCTTGGVRVGYDYRAVDEAGEPIPGLYMAGNDCGGFFAGNYPQYFGGLCMGRSVVGAWLAAHALMGEAYPVPVESARLASAGQE